MTGNILLDIINFVNIIIKIQKLKIKKLIIKIQKLIPEIIFWNFRIAIVRTLLYNSIDVKEYFTHNRHLRLVSLLPTDICGLFHYRIISSYTISLERS